PWLSARTVSSPAPKCFLKASTSGFSRSSGLDPVHARTKTAEAAILCITPRVVMVIPPSPAGGPIISWTSQNQTGSHDRAAAASCRHPGTSRLLFLVGLRGPNPEGSIRQSLAKIGQDFARKGLPAFPLGLTLRRGRQLE